MLTEFNSTNSLLELHQLPLCTPWQTHLLAERLQWDRKQKQYSSASPMLMGSRRFMAWLRKAQSQASCKPSLRGYSRSFVYALGLAAFPCKRCMRISFCAKGSTDNFALTWMLTSSRPCVNEVWKVIFKSSCFFKRHCTFQLLQTWMAFTLTTCNIAW